jgi:hypothetical protein
MKINNKNGKGWIISFQKKDTPALIFKVNSMINALFDDMKADDQDSKFEAAETRAKEEGVIKYD